MSLPDGLRAFGINSDDIDIAEERIYDTINDVKYVLDSFGIDNDLQNFNLSQLDGDMRLDPGCDGTNIIIKAELEMAADALNSIDFLTQIIGCRNFDTYANARDSHINVDIPDARTGNMTSYMDGNIADAIKHTFYEIIGINIYEIIKAKLPNIAEDDYDYLKDIINDAEYEANNNEFYGDEYLDFIRTVRYEIENAAENDPQERLITVYDNLDENVKAFIDEEIKAIKENS